MQLPGGLRSMRKRHATTPHFTAPPDKHLLVNLAATNLMYPCHFHHKRAVDVVCRHGPARVLELVQLGADFTRNRDGSLHLTREGGHSGRRIVHAADLTGAEIERALLAAARATGNVEFFEHHLAVDLVTDEVGRAAEFWR
jgi:aspartate oxidase